MYYHKSIQKGGSQSFRRYTVRKGFSVPFMVTTVTGPPKNEYRINNKRRLLRPQTNVFRTISSSYKRDTGSHGRKEHETVVTHPFSIFVKERQSKRSRRCLDFTQVSTTDRPNVRQGYPVSSRFSPVRNGTLHLHETFDRTKGSPSLKTLPCR